MKVTFSVKGYRGHHRPHMIIGVQGFDFGYEGTKQEAKWMIRMMKKALKNYKNDEPEPD